MGPSFVRSAIRNMPGYTPGEQPAPGERVIKLNTNENPFPPSDRVMQAIRDVSPDVLRKYPSPDAAVFRQAAAQLLSVTPEMIITGNGSDDVLSFCLQTFVEPGGVLAYPDPTYSLYPVLAELDDVRVAAVPWERGWSLPIDALVAANPRAIFLANPNAPSGTVVPRSTLKTLLSNFSGLLLIDEAYCDFSGGNCLDLVREHENVMVVRTLSKAYSLAGVRFGYAVGQPSVIAQVSKARDSYPCDAISIAAATAAILDQAYARTTWDYVRAERSRMSDALAGLGWDVIPSSANFVFGSVPQGKARAMLDGLKARGILVRYFDKPGLNDKLRITIGTRAENDAVLEAVRSISADKTI